MKTFVGAIEINGIDLSYLDGEEQLNQINKLHRIILQIQEHVTLFKVDSNWVFQKNINYLKQLNQSLSGIQKNETKNFMDLFQWLSQEKEFIKNNWYLIFYASSEKELEEKTKEYYRLFNNLFDVRILNNQEISLFVHKILNPLDDDVNEIDFNHEFDKIKFKSWYFSKNNSKDNDTFYAINSIYNKKGIPNWYWLYSFASFLKNTVVVHIYPIDSYMQKRFIQKTLVGLETKAIGTTNTKTERVDKSELKSEYMLMDDVTHDVAKNIEKLFQFTILILSYGKSKTELRDALKELNVVSKDTNMLVYNCEYQQKLLFPLLFPNNYSYSSNNTLVLPAKSFAATFPFQKSILDDANGLFMGVNRSDSPVILDIFKRSNSRINSNGLIMGESGSGKTTTMKKLINFHLATNGIVFIIDPESEYKDLTKNWNGLVVNGVNGDTNKINPLQIMINDDTKQTSNAVIVTNHISFLKDFFKQLNLPLNDSQRFMLVEVKIKQLFEKLNFYNCELDNLTSEDFPTFNDLIAFLKEDDLYKTNDPSYLQILQVIEESFTKNGIYENVFNGYSKLKFDNYNIIDFDLKDLLTNNDRSRVSATITLIISYITSAINKNAYTQKDPKKVLLVFDEFHLFINSSDLTMLRFCNEKMKRMRKLNGGFWFSTQNPSDLVGNEEIMRLTQGIVNNAQYSILGSFKPNDIASVQKIYQNSSIPLTETELDWMKEEVHGQFIIVASNKLRQMLNIEVADFEWEKIGYGINQAIDAKEMNLQNE